MVKFIKIHPESYQQKCCFCQELILDLFHGYICHKTGERIPKDKTVYVNDCSFWR